MSVDALRAVLNRLPLPKRLEMAVMDAEIFELAVCFEKICSVLVLDTYSLLGMDGAGACGYRANEVVKTKELQTSGAPNPHYLDKILKHCPAILSLYVQMKLSPDSLCLIVKEKADTLKKLFISNENFKIDWPTELQETGFKRLKTLSILQRSNQKLAIGPRITPQRLKPVLPPTLENLTLTGCFLELPMLQQLFSATTLPQLRRLDLLGCLVDTNQAAHLIPELQMPPRLEKVTLPPSLFSFATTSTAKFDLKWLKCKQIGLYMESYEEEVFLKEMERLFAKETETLELYGHWSKLKATGKPGKMKQVKILYNNSQSRCLQPDFASNHETFLLGHLVRSSPYTRAERRTSRSETWRFDSATAQDDEPTRVVRRQPGERPDLENRLARMFWNGRGGAAGIIRRGQVPQAPPPPPQDLLQPAGQPPQQVVGNGQPQPPQQPGNGQQLQPPNDAELALILAALLNANDGDII